jgi:hypothetical protein
MTNDVLKKFGQEIATALSMRVKEPAPADTFDINVRGYGVSVGDNKFGLQSCPMCKRLPSHPTKEQGWPWTSAPPPQGMYLFYDELSAVEYRISGLCQHCQDDVFRAPNDDDSDDDSIVDAEGAL